MALPAFTSAGARSPSGAHAGAHSRAGAQGLVCRACGGSLERTGPPERGGPLLRPLTRAELEVVDAIRREMIQPEIASWLGISPVTVRVLVHTISEALPRRGSLRGFLRVWVFAHHGE